MTTPTIRLQPIIHWLNLIFDCEAATEMGLTKLLSRSKTVGRNANDRDLLDTLASDMQMPQAPSIERDMVSLGRAMTKFHYLFDI